MRASVSKSKITGRVEAPASKSFTIRALMCAALARGESEIVNPLLADDTAVAWRVLEQVGVSFTSQNNIWQVHGDSLHAPQAELYCGDSAATLRFLTAICAAIPGECRLTVGASLAKRPIKPLIEALRQLGVDCASVWDFPPVTVRGGVVNGGIVVMPGNISSQFISAMLLLAPLTRKGLTINLTTPLASKPYVLMTLDCLKQFGISVAHNDDLSQFKVLPQAYQPTRYAVEGDWSSASYLLALGAIAGDVEVGNLNTGSLQADRALLDILRDMGAKIEISENSVRVRQSKLKGVRADLTDCIDLLPTVAVLAALADGQCELSGIARARLKESDRVSAVSEGLRGMGVAVTLGSDSLIVTGGKPRGAVIDSRCDHRIAMAFSVLGAAAGDTVIEGAGCVSKTYPDYWREFQNVGGKVQIDEK
jgi:3-phosphoshikimate 1-carboxyvinyltransferase